MREQRASRSLRFVLGQVTEKFREAVKAMAERERIPIYQFDHQERNAACAMTRLARLRFDD